MAFIDKLPPFLQGLVVPSMILFMAVDSYVRVLFDGLRHDLRVPADLRSKAFGVFWERLSPGPPDPSEPLVGSAALVPPLLAQISGVVLDIGPGNGGQVTYLDPAANQITKIYGAEPAVALHKSLRKNLDATKLGNKYEILTADATKASIARALSRLNAVTSPAGADPMFDTIVCVRVLCSVPDLDGTISDLYSMLKPGGRLVLVEHTVNPWRTAKGSIIARLVQTMYMLLGWSYFVGDCSLTKGTEDALRKDAKNRWESLDIERNFGKAVLTYISGVLTKKS